MPLPFVAKEDNLALLLLYVQVCFCSEIDISESEVADFNLKQSWKKAPG